MQIQPWINYWRLSMAKMSYSLITMLVCCRTLLLQFIYYSISKLRKQLSWANWTIKTIESPSITWIPFTLDSFLCLPLIAATAVVDFEWWGSFTILAFIFIDKQMYNSNRSINIQQLPAGVTVSTTKFSLNEWVSCMHVDAMCLIHLSVKMQK